MSIDWALWGGIGTGTLLSPWPGDEIAVGVGIAGYLLWNAFGKPLVEKDELMEPYSLHVTRGLELAPPIAPNLHTLNLGDITSGNTSFMLDTVPLMTPTPDVIIQSQVAGSLNTSNSCLPRLCVEGIPELQNATPNLHLFQILPAIPGVMKWLADNLSVELLEEGEAE